jgi:microcystin-dependent protein
MATPYVINFTSLPTEPTLTGKTPFIIAIRDLNGPSRLLDIPPGSANTPLDLPGSDRNRYGEKVDESLVRLLENFASPTASPPTAPTVGQLWFDSTKQNLKVRIGSTIPLIAPAWVELLRPGVAATADINMGGFKITNLGAPTVGTDATRKTYVDSSTVSFTGTDVSSSSSATVNGTAGVLALVNVGTPVVASFVKITTDTKGRVSATTPVVALDITSLVDATYVNVGGDTMTGVLNTSANINLTGAAQVVLPNTPTLGTHATNKTYVDSQVAATIPAGAIIDFGGNVAPTGWLNCDGSSQLTATYPVLFTAIGYTWGGSGANFNVPNLNGRTTVGLGVSTLVETFTAGAVNTVSDTATVGSNFADHWVTGMTVVITDAVGGSTAPTTSPAGLLDFGDTVYIIRNGTTSVKFATSLANAQNGTAINITATGSGTFAITYTGPYSRTLATLGGEEAHAMSSTELLSHTHTYQRGDPGGDADNGGANGTIFWTTQSTGATGGNAAMNIMTPYAVVRKIIKT